MPTSSMVRCSSEGYWRGRMPRIVSTPVTIPSEKKAGTYQGSRSRRVIPIKTKAELTSVRSKTSAREHRCFLTYIRDGLGSIQGTRNIRLDASVDADLSLTT